MNYIGCYHTDLKLCAPGICDEPCTTMGRSSFACSETATDASGMAVAVGVMRNRDALVRELSCEKDVPISRIVLQAYHKWGEDYAAHIEGPCASCIMDREKDRLVLTRDRMGECCLFFAASGDRVVFSDHPDAILKTGFISPVIDRNAACELFGLGPARTPGRTPLAGLESLRPGCQLVCDAGEMHIRSYYALCACPHEDNESDTIERTRELLEKAMDTYAQLHPGCMLSGGLDSTALTALLRKRIGRVDSYSVDYEGNERDFVSSAFRPEMDAAYIHMAAAYLGTHHQSFVLSQKELVNGLDDAVRLRGFPGMGDIDSSLMRFAGRIALCNNNVLSGECGDEVFGGYPWFNAEKQWDGESFPWSGSLELRNSVLRREVREKLDIDNYIHESLMQSLDSYDVSAIENEEEKRLFRLQRLCFDYFMPNLQERAVKMCNGMGLSVFTPLCDARLVEYVYNVPWKMKTMGGMEKGLFRAAVSDLLPEKLLKRKKSPYPKTCSPVYANLVRDRMSALIQDKNAPLWQLADAEFIEKMLSTSLNPADMPWFGQLMAGPQLLAYLLQINIWMQERGIRVEL